MMTIGNLIKVQNIELSEFTFSEGSFNRNLCLDDFAVFHYDPYNNKALLGNYQYRTGTTLFDYYQSVDYAPFEKVTLIDLKGKTASIDYEILDCFYNRREVKVLNVTKNPLTIKVTEL